MKNSIRLVALLTVTASILAFTGSTEDKTKINLIHYENGKTLHYDTLFDASSGYTVQEFIVSKGLDPKETEIINLTEIHNQAIKGIYTTSNIKDDGDKQMEVIILKDDIGNGSKWVDKSVEIDSDGNKVITEIKKVVDEDGNVLIEKLINGEAVEITAAEREEIENMWVSDSVDKDGDTHLVTGKGEKRVEISIYGSEIQVLNAVESPGDDVNIHKIVIDNILKEAQSELDSAEIQSLLQEVKKELLNLQLDLMQEQVDIVHEQSFSISELNSFSEPIIITDLDENQEPYTIAIVSTIKGDDTAQPENLNSTSMAHMIRDLKYFPNPTTDKINISFFLEEEGQTNISIYDIEGKEVYRKDLGNFKGAYNDQIDISNLQPGTYLMNIIQNDLRLAEKIIVN